MLRMLRLADIDKVGDQAKAEVAINDDDSDEFEDAEEGASDEAEEFVDAEDQVLPISLDECLKSMGIAIGLYIENRFQDGFAMADVHCKHSMYHSALKSIFLTFNASLSMDAEEIESALRSARQTIKLCCKNKKSSFTNTCARFFGAANFNQYTDVELHAELISAFMLLMCSVLEFIRNQTFFSLIKVALKIKEANGFFRECLGILNKKNNWDSTTSLVNFEAGVFLFNGFMNLGLSHLPVIVLRIVQLVGFYGDRQKGLHYLNHVASGSSEIYSQVAKIFILHYHCYAEIFAGIGPTGDRLMYADTLINEGILKYPNSAIYMFYKAKVLQLEGDLNSSILMYRTCINSQSEFDALHFICYWEMSWCYGLQCDWNSALECTNILAEKCNVKWFSATITYEKASFLYMKMIDENAIELKEEVANLYRLVPTLTRRYAGRRVTPEKIISELSNRFFEQNESILLPIMHSIYMYNKFMMIKNQEEHVNKFVERIKKSLEKRDHITDDDCSFLLLWSGICKRLLNDHSGAEADFYQILEMEAQLNYKIGVAPQSCFELAIVKFELGEFEAAKRWLTKAINEYSNYWLQAIVHIRAQTLRRRIQDSERNGPKNLSHSDSDVGTETESTKPQDLYTQ